MRVRVTQVTCTRSVHGGGGMDDDDDDGNDGEGGEL